MSDIDFENFDNLDFEAASKKVSQSLVQRDKQDAQYIKTLQEGGDECAGGACII